MASRTRASVSAFWCGLARVVNGAPDRLRARRMRVETTTPNSGPDARSYSPSRLVRALRFIFRPQRPDRVAQARRLLVPLGGHGRLELGLQLDAPGPLYPPPVSGRHLADVPDRAVLHSLDQRFEE